MAETVYKDIPALTATTLPLVGTELIEVSATGTTGKATWQNIFGTGWWPKLKAAFASFKAPDATHADDADTVGGEALAAIHAASALIGAIPLANIPATLTGKDADTIDGVHAGIGEGKLQPYHSFLYGTYTSAQIYSALSTIIPSINDYLPINGMLIVAPGNATSGYVVHRAVRIAADGIRLYGMYYDYYHNIVAPVPGYIDVSAAGAQSFYISLTY